MTGQSLDKLSDDELVAGFAMVAKERGLAVLDCDASRANRAFARMNAIEGVFRARGPESRLRLADLLDDKDRLVRYYSAKRLLGVVPELARPVIEDNAKFWFDPIAADARGTLRMLDSGEYKPD